MGAGVSEMVKSNPGFVDSRNVPPPPREAANRRLLIVFDLNGIFLYPGNQTKANPFAELFFRHAADIRRISYAFWTAAEDAQAIEMCRNLGRIVVENAQSSSSPPTGPATSAAAASVPAETATTASSTTVPFNPLFVWGQSKCLVPAGRKSKEKDKPGKPLFLKPISAVWEAFPEFNRNVLIVDHSKEKLLLNPSWSQIVPLPFYFGDHPARNPLVVLAKSIRDWGSLEARELHHGFLRMTSAFSPYTWDISYLFDVFPDPGLARARLQNMGYALTPIPRPIREYEPCLTGDSTVLTAENGWMPISKVLEGSLLWTGLCCNDEHGQQQPVFRRLLRKWEFAVPPERGRVGLVHLAPGCIVTPLHIVFWQGKWQEACRTTLDDAAPSAWIEAPCTCVFNLELDGHEDVVCVGGVVAAAVGFFHCGSQSRMWECSVWSRRSRHCSDPMCSICDTVLVPDLDFQSKTTLRHFGFPAAHERLLSIRAEVQALLDASTATASDHTHFSEAAL